MLITLTLWKSPYDHSGFISLNILNYVLPYPSTFCLAFTFYLLYKFNSKNQKSFYFYGIVSLATAIILLTHLITGLILLIGIFSICFNKNKFSNLTEWLYIIAMISFSLLLVFCWPFYSFYNLITGGGNVYNESNFKMYADVLERTKPAIFAIPIVVYFFIKEKNKTLGIMLSLLFIVYFYGCITEQWSFGRTLSVIIIIIHCHLAKGASILLDYFKNNFLLLFIIWGSIFTTAFYSVYRVSAINLNLFSSERSISYNNYHFLLKATNPGDVILADINSSLPIPALGRKIIGNDHAQAFIKDNEERRKNVESFFGNKIISTLERENVISKYQVKYILIDGTIKITNELEQFLKDKCEFSSENNHFKLYKIKRK